MKKNYSIEQMHEIIGTCEGTKRGCFGTFSLYQKVRLV